MSLIRRQLDDIEPEEDNATNTANDDDDDDEDWSLSRIERRILQSKPRAVSTSIVAQPTAAPTSAPPVPAATPPKKKSGRNLQPSTLPTIEGGWRAFGETACANAGPGVISAPVGEFRAMTDGQLPAELQSQASIIGVYYVGEICLGECVRFHLSGRGVQSDFTGVYLFAYNAFVSSTPLILTRTHASSAVATWPEARKDRNHCLAQTLLAHTGNLEFLYHTFSSASEFTRHMCYEILIGKACGIVPGGVAAVQSRAALAQLGKVQALLALANDPKETFTVTAASGRTAVVTLPAAKNTTNIAFEPARDSTPLPLALVAGMTAAQKDLLKVGEKTKSPVYEARLRVLSFPPMQSVSGNERLLVTLANGRVVPFGGRAVPSFASEIGVYLTTGVRVPVSLNVVVLPDMAAYCRNLGLAPFKPTEGKRKSAAVVDNEDEPAAKPSKKARKETVVETPSTSRRPSDTVDTPAASRRTSSDDTIGDVVLAEGVVVRDAPPDTLAEEAARCEQTSELEALEDVGGIVDAGAFESNDAPTENALPDAVLLEHAVARVEKDARCEQTSATEDCAADESPTEPVVRSFLLLAQAVATDRAGDQSPSERREKRRRLKHKDDIDSDREESDDDTSEPPKMTKSRELKLLKEQARAEALKHAKRKPAPVVENDHDSDADVDDKRPSSSSSTSIRDSPPALDRVATPAEVEAFAAANPRAAVALVANQSSSLVSDGSRGEADACLDVCAALASASTPSPFVAASTSPELSVKVVKPPTTVAVVLLIDETQRRRLKKALIPGAGSPLIETLVANVPPLRAHVEAGFPPVGVMIEFALTDVPAETRSLLLSDDADERRWTKRWFEHGVYDAFGRLLKTGETPNVLECAASIAPNLASNGLAPRVSLRPEVIEVDGQSFRQWGVRANEAFAAGDVIGLYAGELIKGGAAQLDGRYCLYRKAGASEEEATDSYAVGGVEYKEYGHVHEGAAVSAADERFFSTALARANDAGDGDESNNAEIDPVFQTNFNGGLGHERSSGLLVKATRHIPKGAAIHISYGPRWHREARAAGVQIGTTAGLLPAVAARRESACRTAAEIDAEVTFGDLEVDDLPPPSTPPPPPRAVVALPSPALPTHVEKIAAVVENPINEALFGHSFGDVVDSLFPLAGESVLADEPSDLLSGKHDLVAEIARLLYE